MAEQTLPFTIVDVDEEATSKRRARGLAREGRMVVTVPGGVVLPEAYRRLAHSYYTFQFRSDDTLLMAYPKSGTTWGMEILWAMRNPERLHFAHVNHIHDRVYFMDRDILLPNQPGDGFLNSQRFLEECPGGLVEDGVVLQLAVVHRESPRLFATHLPFSLLTSNLLDTCKVVYIARNPKDVCFSFYNFFCLTGNMTKELRDVAELFMAEEMLYGPYSSHLQQAWCRRDHPNLHIMFYEDMKTNLLGELRRLRDFLQIELSEDHLASVAKHTSLEEMREREKSHPMLPFIKEGSFFHGGRVGGWTASAPPDLDARMNQWIKEFMPIDATFKYE